jgi:hypothetical protein
MNVNNDHITGLAVGIGAAALGFYLYKKNQGHVDQWLRQQGINVPQTTDQNRDASSLADLVREKERLEDLIAEREMQAKEAAAAPEPAPAS